MLAASGEAGYISEPLNVHHRPGLMLVPTPRWYTYICEDNETEYLPALRDTLAFRYHPSAEARSLRSRKDVLRMGYEWATFLDGRFLRRRALLKDPFAVFSAPWFHSRLGCQVVITVRHPAGFASSLKRLDWPFDFSDLLEQHLLMRDWLEPYRHEMEAMLRAPEDVIGQAALLWRILYQVVATQQKRYPHFLVARHEDLALDPPEGFRSLYTALGLGFNSRAQKAIKTSSSSDNPKEGSKKNRYAFRLDSRAAMNSWKRRLSREEIERIRCLTGEVAGIFYPEEAWE